ncbi:class D beta-lactamase [Rhodobacter sp. NTK016B]|uniref:class D beta-lactamase n=1 Tax=Rhodobacter sp. NTK016B TaxID=2759676 RepID=UPI001A8F83E6|nr:class D beta-lactamase [Rhodobacter sp. NTK016B]MBN8290864.1 class D beta-lactamase [Rhodobacter sp. NTK016B]
MTRLIVTFFLLFAALPAAAQPLCLMVAEAETGRVLIEDGRCDTRVTPASTFKLAPAVIGFDTGLLQDADRPLMTWQPGEPDWGGAAWQSDVTPASWMRDSVVWYSQRLARALGTDRFAGAVRAFDYGNADVSGDPGYDNGLERAWIASSLAISPREQVDFLHRLLTRQLPAAPSAQARAEALATRHAVAGWTFAGKTGGAYPRRADRSFDYARGWGWYVGWAERDGQRLIVVRLAQDTERLPGSPGRRSRDALFADWPQIARRL